MRHQAYVEDIPTVDEYRLSYTPRREYSLNLLCPWVLVTGESGTTYQFMRAYGLPEQTEVLNFGAYRGDDQLDKRGPLQIPFSDLPAVQPFTVTEAEGEVVYGTPDHSLALGPKGYRWHDAKGRIELEATLLGNPVTFWFPEQEGLTAPMLSRSHLGRVTGSIDGDRVEGLWMHDQMYSTPSLSFHDTAFNRDLHNFWMDWLVEYDDGSLEGGFAWAGRPGTGFTTAHHYVDGRSVAREDAKIDVDFTERGSVEKVTLHLGKDLTVEFAQHGSLDWPIHTYGTVSSISRDKKVVKSWNYSEHFPHNWALVEDYQASYARLYGRLPSLHRILDGAVVRDGLVTFPQAT